jgi:hypothetical protein
MEVKVWIGLEGHCHKIADYEYLITLPFSVFGMA